MPIRGGFPNAPDIIACFDEAPGGGGIQDINSPRNGPAKNPSQYPDKVQWHTEFFQYELAFPIQDVTINHAALAGRQKYWGASNQYWLGDPTYTSALSYRVPGQTSSAQHTLFTHNLGYAPLAFVAYNGRMLMPGVAVQIASEGRNRFVSAYVTDTVVGLREVFNSSLSNLSAMSATYQVIVFKVPEEDADLPLFSQTEDYVQLGHGKINSSKQYLKSGAPSGDTPFDIDKGPTIDIESGRSKIVSGGIATTETGYDGTFVGPDFVVIGV